MTNWRSIADAEIVLHDGAPTLLYGDNDAGKSNVLAGVEAFCRLASHAVTRGHVRAGDSFGWVEHTSGAAPDDVLELGHPIRYGTTRATLAGSLVNDEGVECTLRFDITLDPYAADEDRPVRTVEVVAIDGSAPVALRPALRIGEGRTFHEEFLPDRRSTGPDAQVAPDGAGVKLALFRCANHVRPELRARFHVDFKRMVESSPFALPEPLVAVGQHLEIQILLGEGPIEHRGAGPQQWVLAAAMIATDAPDIVLFEEPETNLSWGAQQRLVDMLREASTERQLVVATHSPHLGNLAGTAGNWYEVRRDVGGETILRQRVGVDSLWQSYGPTLETAIDAGDPRKLTLFPGNLIRIHEAGVHHLGIEAGGVVVTSLDEGGVIRMQSLEAWLADAPGE